MRYPVIASMCIALSALTPRLACAYHQDVHYGATFVLAMAVGMDWEQAHTVASANEAVDQNLFTKPTQYAGLSSPLSPKEPIQHDVGPVSLGLSLQDYVFHCFSPEKDIRGQRSAAVIQNLERLENGANALIDASKASDDSTDRFRALVAVGIYLHCQQDSWSHSGYGGNPLGHIYDDLASKSPDDTWRYPDLTVRALTETVEKLKLFNVRLAGSNANTSVVKFAELFKALTVRPLRATLPNDFIDVPDRLSCHSKIFEYWLGKTVDALSLRNGKLYTIDSEVSYATGGGPSSGPSNLIVIKSSKEKECNLLFKTAFPEIEAAYRMKMDPSNGMGVSITEWVSPVNLSLISLPPQEPIILEVTISASPK
jgi:hypothetical protein